jgi:hypothetical protein
LYVQARVHVLLSWAKVLSVRANRNPQLLSAKIVSDVDTKPLGALPTAAGGIARLAYARAPRAGVELMPLLKKARLIDQQVKDRGARLPWTYQGYSVQISAGVGF